ncbi:MAG: TlpA family protein disulfide reductase [Thaumarchaeota archaeon]|nr:TlpA family protein disulfide reductase [Nitrososphaerota archaeon]
MVAKIGNKAPNLKVSKWVQGLPTNIDKEKENVVLIEVFQVNCPGCFLYGIPESIEIYNKYRKDGVIVLGLATAFEDYDKNTLENLELLLTTDQVIGETYNALSQNGMLQDNKLQYKIPFPVAMDSLKREDGTWTDDRVMDFMEVNIPEFRTYIESRIADTIERVKAYLKTKQFSAETFEEYALRGTPSSILIDKKGVLRQVSFGQNAYLDTMIKELLEE